MSFIDLVHVHSDGIFEVVMVVIVLRTSDE